ncbi:calponin homology domain-containing protein DDB_G0272472-like [Mercenaria mercenaria]|uniref:calponin homology domain-containing protein DDB_G0272472-like n=1 Tax=Mercenaria mercenaria TaxID=6596 RepID=UPI00234EFA3D|nr:calponin homology domain-containing protein DDB_G0272472-like [Mercenaria mercenaria]
MRKEKEERDKMEREEKKRKENEERKRREKEKVKRKAEEEQRRKDEDKLRMEEELRRKREEEERFKNTFTYLTYMGGVTTDLTLRVKDSWKQKDLPAYVGTIRCTVIRRPVTSQSFFSRSIELAISLPKVLDDANNAVKKVKSYIEQVEKKIEELRNAQMAIIKKIQDEIQKIFATFVPGKGGPITARESAYAKLQLAHKLQKISQEIMNDRLNELLQETEIVCAKLKDGADLSYDDIEELKGCLKSWKDAKAQSFEEDKRKLLEEQKRKEEEKRKRRERDEREMKEREEKKRKKDEERKRREKEEAERKAEEERKRKKEEERLRMEEELRRKKEEEERLKREEEERRKRLEEERKHREEEAARKREDERQRCEAERRERERLQKEAKERAWRQDPNNWNPYQRDCDEVDGKRAYHGGIKCVMASPPGSIEKDDLECCASEAVDSIIEILETNEKPVSSIIDIHAVKGTLHSEVHY